MLHTASVKKKREQRLCLNIEPCIYKSYFGQKCVAHKRIIWSTCRFKTKKSGGEHGKTKTT